MSLQLKYRHMRHFVHTQYALEENIQNHFQNSDLLLQHMFQAMRCSPGSERHGYLLSTQLDIWQTFNSVMENKFWLLYSFFWVAEVFKMPAAQLTFYEYFHSASENKINCAQQCFKTGWTQSHHCGNIISRRLRWFSPDK